jgi:hypothetical protein
MQQIQKILLKNALFTSVIALISFILFKTIFSEYSIPVFWVLLLVLAFATAIIHLVLLKLTNSSSSRFFSQFFLVTGIKMIFLLAFIVAYSFLHPKQAVPFLISFLSLYFVYTVFEVLIIVPFFKKPNK